MKRPVAAYAPWTFAPWKSAPSRRTPSLWQPAESARFVGNQPIQLSAPGPLSPRADKLRLMSEAARGEGGRVWVPRKKGDKRDWKSIPANERFYFLEEWYPKYGNLVPRD